MNMKGWGLLATLGMLAACTMPSVAPTHPAGAPESMGAEPLKEGFPFDLQDYPDGNPFRVLAVDELSIVSARADSEASGLGVHRAVDGDLSTQCLNGPYRAPTAWVALELAESAAIAAVRIKTGTSPAGTRYDIQVSPDGANWTTALANQTNSGWTLETKALPAGTQGRFVRVFWHNAASSPQAHFAIYELAVDGVAGPAPSPTATPSASPSAPASPTPTPPPAGTLSRVMPTAVTASSSQPNLPPARAIDGNVATQWSSGGYKAPEEDLTLAFAAQQTFGRIRIKTGALPEGITFKVDVSDDGVNWSPASGRLTNRTWGMESQDVYGAGKFLKVRFFNSLSAPIARFSVFELEAYATGGGAAPPPPPPRRGAPPRGPWAPPTPTPTAPTGAAAWYPDWIGIATQSYYIDRANGRTKLRFSTGIANIGAGHVQVRINQNTKVATQEILDGNNRVIATKDASQVVYFEAHGHNHVEGVARYDFRQGSLTGPVLRTSVKTSFCVEDSYKYRSTAEAARYPDCLPEIMGITRNYADLYTANLPGQDFDVTGLPAGEYYVVVLIDPEQVFLDASRSNNTAWTRFHIDPA
ncbi:MAG: discoidin domain-containing protein, partial [Candidatus Sericytochromatia bacterium]